MQTWGKRTCFEKQHGFEASLFQAWVKSVFKGKSTTPFPWIFLLWSPAPICGRSPLKKLIHHFLSCKSIDRNIHDICLQVDKSWIMVCGTLLINLFLGDFAKHMFHDNRQLILTRDVHSVELFYCLNLRAHYVWIIGLARRRSSDRTANSTVMEITERDGDAISDAFVNTTGWFRHFTPCHWCCSTRLPGFHNLNVRWPFCTRVPDYRFWINLQKHQKTVNWPATTMHLGIQCVFWASPPEVVIFVIYFTHCPWQIIPDKQILYN